MTRDAVCCGGHCQSASRAASHLNSARLLGAWSFARWVRVSVMHLSHHCQQSQLHRSSPSPFLLHVWSRPLFSPVPHALCSASLCSSPGWAPLRSVGPADASPRSGISRPETSDAIAQLKQATQATTTNRALQPQRTTGTHCSRSTKPLLSPPPPTVAATSLRRCWLFKSWPEKPQPNRTQHLS